VKKGDTTPATAPGDINLSDATEGADVGVVRDDLQGKVVNAFQGETVNFRTFWLGGEICRAGVINLVALACVFRATTKKGRQLFEEKSAPQRKSWLRLWGRI